MDLSVWVLVMQIYDEVADWLWQWIARNCARYFSCNLYGIILSPSVPLSPSPSTPPPPHPSPATPLPSSPSTYPPLPPSTPPPSPSASLYLSPSVSLYSSASLPIPLSLSLPPPLIVSMYHCYLLLIAIVSCSRSRANVLQRSLWNLCRQHVILQARQQKSYWPVWHLHRNWRSPG